MSQLATFPITRKWPPQHPDRIQLYSLPPPNGVKVSIALDQETAIEAGGELLGRRNHVDLAMSAPITVIALENSPR